VEADLLARSHNSKATIAPHSGHGIAMEDPEVLFQAIREVVSAAQKQHRVAINEKAGPL
jgi:pimeloyl-ACP methyl ester carboxylesterase